CSGLMVPAFGDFLGSFMVVSYEQRTRRFQPPDSKPGYSVMPPPTMPGTLLERRSVRFPGSFRSLTAGDRQTPRIRDLLSSGGAESRRMERHDEDRRTPLDAEPHDQQTRADAAEAAGEESAPVRHAPAP